MLFIYTGADEKSPTYRRGILDALSYPAGHVMEFSYRVKYIEKSLHPKVPLSICHFVSPNWCERRQT